MSADDHGDKSTYSNHGCRCGPCTVAHRESCRQQRDARRAREVPISTPHGLESTYSNWYCRCSACREARREYQAEKRRRRASK